VRTQVLHDFLFDPKSILLKIREKGKDFPGGNSSSVRTLLRCCEDEGVLAGAVRAVHWATREYGKGMPTRLLQGKWGFGP
jgi:hypothetical protein